LTFVPDFMFLYRPGSRDPCRFAPPSLPTGAMLLGIEATINGCVKHYGRIWAGWLTVFWSAWRCDRILIRTTND
jgi:hypothetical protein